MLIVIIHGTPDAHSIAVIVLLRVAVVLQLQQPLQETSTFVVTIPFDLQFLRNHNVVLFDDFILPFQLLILDLQLIHFAAVYVTLFLQLAILFFQL